MFKLFHAAMLDNASTAQMFNQDVLPFVMISQRQQLRELAFAKS